MNLNGKKILFVYNPKAGKGKIKTHLPEILNIFTQAGGSVTVHPTQERYDAMEVVKKREKGIFDCVVCSGGDGTLDEVVTGMVECEEKIPIGYIPAGSTNDFAKSLEIPNNMLEAAHGIVEGNEFSCDVGRFNEDAFVYIAAFGLFTEVSYETDQQMKNVLGHMAYILEGAKSLSSIKPYQMKVESEEGVFEGEFIYGMITNSISVGGFKNITGKDVELDDGKFEVTLVRCPKSLGDLNNLATALLTQKMDSKELLHFKTSYLKIKSDEEISWTLDGEYGGTYKAVSIENEKRAISMICSKKEA